MPSADPRAREIVRTIGEFEASVSAAEIALVARDWPLVSSLLRDQRRLTHALANSLDETRDQRPPAFTEEVDRRIEMIRAQREDQLNRLIAFNQAVNSRLAVISRSREMHRVTAQRTPEPRILNTFQ